MGLTAVALLAVFTLLVIKFNPTTFTAPSKNIVSSSDIRGMAVMHKGIPYTLNFDQQKTATDVIARAVQVKKADYPKSDASFAFDKIIVYRFNAPDVELLPIQFQDDNLVFSVPVIDPNVYYLELSGGELKQMISSSFDP